MTPVRLGAVGYLNARPCVVGLDRHPRFDLRFDLPARCAALLHDGAIDVGLIPSIEYLRNPQGAGAYRMVPGVAIASAGRVASVALFTTRPISAIQSIALDTSSRTSVALTRVMCAKVFGIDPTLEPHAPDLESMLERCDAALLIGDVALWADPRGVTKIDLGEAWTSATGLPFVYAFWAGRPDALTKDDVRTIQAARDAGVAEPDAVAREYLHNPALDSAGAAYLRDNIKYAFADPEQQGLMLFYRYAAELGLVPSSNGLKFF